MSGLPTHEENYSHISLPTHLRLPILVRRWAAWSVEVSLVAATALVPFYLGVRVNDKFTSSTVPLNPVLATVETGIGKAFGIPKQPTIRTVAPLTNLLWTAALVAPMLAASIQLYDLTRSGKTLPKRWFGVRVVTPSGAPPHLFQVLVREGLGRWGIPLTAAYLVWRYLGAFPDLGLLAGMSIVTLVAEQAIARVDGRQRAFHDRLSGTFVIDAITYLPPTSTTYRHFHFFDRQDPENWAEPITWTDEDDAIAAIVLTPEPSWEQRGLWPWMRRHPGLTLLIMALSSLGLLLGTFVGTQVYIQSQANRREFKEQDNEMFLSLVNRLDDKSTRQDELQSTVLALGKLNDPRALPLLVDLLSQADDPLLIDALQQALVSKGPDTLPHLRRLNLSLKADLESLKRGTNAQEQHLAALRQRATQRAIAKILTVYSGQVHTVDLSRVDLGQTITGPAQFTLVLDQIDLSGLQLRSVDFTNASLRGAKFYGAGPDGYWGTFDDWMTDLSGAKMKGVDLTGAFMSNVTLNRANLIRATLNQVDLSKARMNRANLSSARLVQANLSQSNLTNASLTGADLGDANFSDANLEGARFGQASALGVNLRGANLVDSDWRGADLSGADLSNANLQNADFTAAQLLGTNLTNAQLQNVVFRNADLSMANLRGAKLDGADFQGATFALVTATSPNQFIKLAPQPEQSNAFKGVDFSNARNISAEQLSYLCAQGGIHPKCEVTGGSGQ